MSAIKISMEAWLKIGASVGWAKQYGTDWYIAEDSGKYKKLDTQLFPECEGTPKSRDVVKKNRKRKKKAK